MLKKFYFNFNPKVQIYFTVFTIKFTVSVWTQMSSFIYYATCADNKNNLSSLQSCHTVPLPSQEPWVFLEVHFPDLRREWRVLNAITSKFCYSLWRLNSRLLTKARYVGDSFGILLWNTPPDIPEIWRPLA